MAEQKKLPKFTSPKGVFKYPRLNEADTKFKAEGEFSVKLITSGPTFDWMCDKLRPLHEQAVAEGEATWKGLKPEVRKKNPFKTVDFYTPIYDADENETGEFEFKFAMKASGVTKAGKPWERKPAIFDAKGQPMVKPPAIWGGTIGKVSFEVLPFFVAAVGAGLSLRLQAVQIIELRSGGDRSASEYGFGQEDGYSYEEQASNDGFGDETAADGDDASSDDADF